MRILGVESESEAGTEMPCLLHSSGLAKFNNFASAFRPNGSRHRQSPHGAGQAPDLDAGDGSYNERFELGRGRTDIMLRWA